jgi:predicted phosphodiesterase
LDFFQISRFTKTKRKRSVAQELETARAILDSLNEAFPNVPIYFLQGNHDNRLELYLAEKAPELLDCEEFKLEQLLDARKHNMVVLDDRTLIKVDKLAITHGHLLIKGFFAPVSPARGAFLKAKASILIGHTHKVSTHTETTISNKMIVCYSTGCLCELQPDYNPFGNNYSHGFAFIVRQPVGKYQVKNVQILDGVIIN